MSITISIIKSPANVTNPHTSMVFAENGGTIGRANNNVWVLDDPERFMSSRHSQVTCENGQYYLTDLSTNGTFLNGSPEPIGKGNKVALNDGDVFSLSDYEFQVNLEESDIFSSGSPFSFVPETPGIEVDYLENDTGQSDPFGASVNAHVSTAEPLFAGFEETDPLAALDKANGAGFSQESYSDNAEAINHAAHDWPNPVAEAGVIPDDWDDEVLVADEVRSTEQVAPVVPPVQKQKPVSQYQAHAVSNDIINQLEAENRLLQEENKKLQADVDLLAKQIRIKQKKPNSATAIDHLLIEAMGLAGKNLTEERMMEISQTVGELMRETISGLMQVLTSRSTVKNEFRMNVTTIQPVENNPLKFSATVEDALDNMFIRDSQAYKGPTESVREGFQSIAEHQVAILAGIRAAFRGVITRFDPITLEQRFEKYRKAGLLQMVNKGKNWDSYKEYYNELVNDMDNSFQHLFGYDFVQAYEDQLLKLSSSRRTKVI